VDFFFLQKGDSATVVTFLVLHFVFLLAVAATYLRLILVINLDSGLVPLNSAAGEKGSSGRGRDVEAQRYHTGPDTNPDSPGLERFYSKDVFVCENDGRPRWCSSCRVWKPDRAHHSSEINRCVRKMDHFCPWAGGIISETCTFLSSAPTFLGAELTNIP
jgi:palmitoyltransferase